MKCEFCRNEVDVNASKCPHCGAPIDNKKEKVIATVDEVVKNVPITNINNANYQNNNINTKKKSKKGLIIVLSILFIAVIAFVVWFFVFNGGSFKKIDSKEVFKEASNNVKNLNNYTMDMSIDASMSYNGVKTQFGITGNMLYDNKNKKAKISYKALGENIDVYASFDDKNMVIYTKDEYNDNWIKSSTLMDLSAQELVSNMIMDNTEITKVKSDEKGLAKYKVSINLKKIMDLTDTKELDNIGYAEMIPNTIDAYIYVNSDNYIEKIYIDLLEAFNNKNIFGSGYSFDKLSITLTLSKFNQTEEIVIPQEALNAIDTTNINSDLDLLDIDNDQEVDLKYDEEDIMYDIALSASVYCEEGKIDFSNYNGELDTYLYLDEYDLSSVKEGILSIDSECSVTVEKEFKINDKICTYDKENFESCK